MFENYVAKIKQGFLFFDPEILKIKQGKKSIKSIQKKYEKRHEDALQKLKVKAEEHNIPLQKMIYYKGNLIYRSTPDSVIETIDKGDIQNSIIYDCSLGDKILIVDSVIIKSQLKEVKVYDSVISYSYLRNGGATSCTINTSILRNSSCRETKASDIEMQSSTSRVSTLTDSTIINSSIYTSKVKHCRSFDDIYRDSTLTDVNSSTSLIGNSTINKAHITSSVLKNVTLRGFEHFSDIHQSDLHNVNISGRSKNITMDSVYIHQQNVWNIRRFSLQDKVAYLTNFYTDGKYVYGYVDRNCLYPNPDMNRKPHKIKLRKDLYIERGRIHL